MYHRVGQATNAWEARYCISPGNFAVHMRALSRKGYRAVDIDALVDWLEGGPPLPEGTLVVTFDDGFGDVRKHALPVLEALSWPFTVFLVSDPHRAGRLLDTGLLPGRVHPSPARRRRDP